MPTYEYLCRGCGERLEVVQSFSDAALTTCPSCQGELRKLFSAAGLIFKGSGWHVKDYAASGSGGTGSSGTSGPSASPTDSGAARSESGAKPTDDGAKKPDDGAKKQDGRAKKPDDGAPKPRPKPAATSAASSTGD